MAIDSCELNYDTSGPLLYIIKKTLIIQDKKDFNRKKHEMLTWSEIIHALYILVERFS